MTGHLDLAADHLAAARFRGQEDDQEFSLANLGLDLARPRLADRQPAIDEDPVARPLEAGDNLCRQCLVGFNVAFIAEKDSRSVSLYAPMHCGH